MSDDAPTNGNILSTGFNPIFKSLKGDQRLAILGLIMRAMAVEKRNQKCEHIYLDYLAAELGADRYYAAEQLLALGMVPIVYGPLISCSDLQKAAICFLLRGIVNLNKPASEKEINYLREVEFITSFDFDIWYRAEEALDSKDYERFNEFVLHVAFPPMFSKMSQEGILLNSYLAMDIPNDSAKVLFVGIVVKFELSLVRDTETVKAIIPPVYRVTNGQIRLLYRYLSTRAMFRLVPGWNSLKLLIELIDNPTIPIRPA